MNGRASQRYLKAPSEPDVRCSPTERLVGSRLSALTGTPNGWYVTAFTRGNDLPRNQQTVFGCQCATEHVYYSTNVQFVQVGQARPLPQTRNAPSIPTAQAEGLTARLDNWSHLGAVFPIIDTVGELMGALDGKEDIG
jgi:hypothetical protein